MDTRDFVIVGTGPAGLAAAFELRSRLPRASISILDKASVSSGGLRNDCKMNFTWPIGFPLDYWPRELAEPYLERVTAFLKPTILPKTNMGIWSERARNIGVELLDIQQTHLGTDGGLALIKELHARLEEADVEVATGEEAISINPESRVLQTSKREIGFKAILVAPGRGGFDFLRREMKKLGIAYHDNALDVGLRMETRLERYPIVKDFYDPKFLFPERVRTFCTNSGAAHVVKEKYTTAAGETYFSVNGHAWSSGREPNGLVNFAILRSVAFTEPLASGQDFAEILGLQAMLAGGGKPLMQRVGDFRMGKRSTQGRFTGDLYDFEPSLKDCTPGDISMAIPAKFLHSIWKALKSLDSIVPGILHPSTIMYYPEIKLYANKPHFVDERHFMALPGIFLAGDGAGTSRGITGAWASGLRAADGMLAFADTASAAAASRATPKGAAS